MSIFASISNRMKQPWIPMAMAAGVLLGPVQDALAYIPPSAFVVRQMTQKKAGFKGLRVKSTVIAYEGEKPTGARFRETLSYDPVNFVLRSRALDEAGKELFVQERKLGPGENSFSSLVDRLLLSSDPPGLLRVLGLFGIPVKTDGELESLPDEEARRAAEVSRMTRYRGTVAWIFGGSKGNDAKAPELWVEKDTFLPLRLVAKSGDTLLDATFQEYRFYREFPYPRVISVNPGTTPVVRVELGEVVVGAEVAAEFKKPVTAGWTEAGNSAPGAIRDLVRAHYDLVR